MESLTTNGITINVESSYEEQHSNPDEQKFVFSYVVRIENNTASDVQLLARHWIITDANLTVKEVEGEGVIGEQPVINPGKSHVYSSWCPLPTEFGKMEGYYWLKRLSDGRHFKAKIPVFRLTASYVNN